MLCCRETWTHQFKLMTCIYKRHEVLIDLHPLTCMISCWYLSISLEVLHWTETGDMRCRTCEMSMSISVQPFRQHMCSMMLTSPYCTSLHKEEAPAILHITLTLAHPSEIFSKQFSMCSSALSLHADLLPELWWTDRQTDRQTA